MMGSFKSYVGLEEYEMSHVQGTSANGEMLQPQFLPGELVIAEAASVLKYTSLSKKKGLSGSLYVTNARLVFVSNDRANRCEDSIPLLSINTLCHYEEDKNSGVVGKKAKKKVKLVTSNSKANSSLFYSGSTRIFEILVICSNFRTLRVSFKFSPIDHGRRICNALIHHSFPDKLERLFYFDYCEFQKNSRPSYITSYSNGGSVPYYNVQGDWLREMKKTRLNGYRLSEANENFSFCRSLPEWILVPSSLSDVRLISLAEKMKACRPPFLSWGDIRGASIIRMAKLNNEGDSPAENAFFELLRKSHPKMKQPIIHDLEEPFPLKEIKSSFNKLIEMCCPESYAQYEEIDSKFYSLIDQSKWLFWISRILRLSGEIADSINSDSSVVIIQEHESRDISCVISSVVQVLLEARFRTIIGFFTLIQKEWIAFGHPFQNYMHASPLFLLFLDTIYQLLMQNPFDFEFNEQLLIDIWDSSFDSASGSFIFDSAGQRKDLEHRKEFNFWNRILSKEEIIDNKEKSQLDTDYPIVANKLIVRPGTQQSIPKSLLNPLHKLKPLIDSPTINGLSSNSLILCSSLPCDIQFWHSLYLSRNEEITPRTQDPSSSTGSSTGQINSPSKPNTPNTSGSSGSCDSVSPYRTTSFVFNSHQISPVDPFEHRSGRNPLYEMKLVDSLLTALSTSNRYQNHNQRNHEVNTNSSTSTSASGSSRNQFQYQKSPNHTQRNPIILEELNNRLRKNPFNNSHLLPQSPPQSQLQSKLIGIHKPKIELVQKK